MKNLLVLGAFLFSTSSLYADDLLVIGLTNDGEEKVHQTTTQKVEKALLKANLERKRIALEVLEKNQGQSDWKLSKFSLGLGLEGEAGLGPWNLGLAIKQRLVLKRVANKGGL